MKLAEHEADLIENLLQHEGWKLIVRMIEERVTDRERQVLTGRAQSHEEYLALCESIREALYLRDRPMQMVNEARRKR